MSNLKQLVEKARTCRRYTEGYTVSYETLEELVDIARIAPSAKNAQLLRYALINDKETCAQLEPTYILGGALQGADRPQKGHEPNAYILILGPEKLGEWNTMDVGICGQLIQLAATEKGLAACMVGRYNGDKILKILADKGFATLDPVGLKQAEPEQVELRVRLLIAIGKPAESQALKEANTTEPIMYFRENDINIVPKRVLSDLIVYKG